MLERNAVKLAKELQQFKDVDGNDWTNSSDNGGDHVSRRRTIHNLQPTQKNAQFTGNLDAVFRKRIESLEKIALNGNWTTFYFSKLLADLLSFIFWLDDPKVKNRMSIRRNTLHKLVGRNSTIINEVRRRSSVAFQEHDANKARRRSSMAAMTTNHEEDSE